MDKLRIRQAIVVEGKYDQNALRQLVDTPIFTTNGFTGMKDPALLRLLRQTAETTGLIILTDSDGAGFLIRNTLKSALPAEGVLHAYIPDIPGKERRKRKAGKEGKLANLNRQKFFEDENLVAYTMGDRAYIKFVMKPRQQLIVALKSRKWWWNSYEEAWSTYLDKLDKEWVQNISTRYADYV